MLAVLRIHGCLWSCSWRGCYSGHLRPAPSRYHPHWRSEYPTSFLTFHACMSLHQLCLEQSSAFACIHAMAHNRHSFPHGRQEVGKGWGGHQCCFKHLFTLHGLPAHTWLLLLPQRAAGHHPPLISKSLPVVVMVL